MHVLTPRPPGPWREGEFPALTNRWVFTTLCSMSPVRRGETLPIFNRIRVLRAERGMSRAQLAELIDVNPQTVGALERGDHYPSLDLAFRICDVFDLPVEAVFSRTEFTPLSTELYQTPTPRRPDMSTASLIDRYEDYRTRRFLTHEATFAKWLPAWRTRHRRRILAGAVVALISAMFVISVATYFFPVVAIVWLAVVLVFLPTWTCLQIVSGRQSDAPRHALDEREIAERNSARSIGLSVAPEPAPDPDLRAPVEPAVRLHRPQSAVLLGGWIRSRRNTFQRMPARQCCWRGPDPTTTRRTS